MVASFFAVLIGEAQRRQIAIDEDLPVRGEMLGIDGMQGERDRSGNRLRERVRHQFADVAVIPDLQGLRTLVDDAIQEIPRDSRDLALAVGSERGIPIEGEGRARLLRKAIVAQTIFHGGNSREIAGQGKVHDAAQFLIDCGRFELQGTGWGGGRFRRPWFAAGRA